MSRAEQIEAYVMPSGVTMQLLRETAAKRPGKTRLIHKLDQHKASTCTLILGKQTVGTSYVPASGLMIRPWRQSF